MTKRTTDHSHRRLQSYLVLGIFALLGVSEIIFVVTGVQRLDNPRTWMALAGAIIIVGLIILVLVGRVANFVAKWREPTHLARTPSSSPFETRLDGFDLRYEELLRCIDRLPDTGRKTDRDCKRRLLEIAMALKEIKERLVQMSGTYPYKEDLQELERQVLQQTSELLGIDSTSGTLWTQLRTRGTGFYQDFKKAFTETSELEMLLMKNLEHPKKKEKKT